MDVLLYIILEKVFQKFTGEDLTNLNNFYVFYVFYRRVKTLPKFAKRDLLLIIS